MGAGASVSSPRSGQPVPMDGDTEVALFTMMTREYEQMMHDELADELMFERMKHVRSRLVWLVANDRVRRVGRFSLILSSLVLPDLRESVRA